MQMRLTALLARDLLAHSGLSYQDYAVLVALTDQPDGQMRLFQLGNELGWKKPHLPPGEPHGRARACREEKMWL